MRFEGGNRGRYVAGCVVSLTGNDGAVDAGLPLASDKRGDCGSRDGAKARRNDDLGAYGDQDRGARGALRRRVANGAVRSLYAKGYDRRRRIARYAVVLLRYASEYVAYSDCAVHAASA